MTWLTRQQVEQMGFAFVAPDALLSAKASYFNCRQIEIGNRSRIDDFAILSAGEEGIKVGSNVHVAAFCFLAGAAEIRLSDFSGLSSRVSIYSSSDDYSGVTLTNPTVAKEFIGVRSAPVHLGRHVILGSGSVVLPGTYFGDGAALGALSLASGKYEEFCMYAGVPARRIRDRQRGLIEKERRYREFLQDKNAQTGG